MMCRALTPCLPLPSSAGPQVSPLSADTIAVALASPAKGVAAKVRGMAEAVEWRKLLLGSPPAEPAGLPEKVPATEGQLVPSGCDLPCPQVCVKNL